MPEEMVVATEKEFKGEGAALEPATDSFNNFGDIVVEKPRIGDIVIFHSDHSRKVNYPAIIQEVLEDGSVRLWIFSVMSIYVQVALEGNKPNHWSRRA